MQERGQSFEDALREAQQLGFAEADPTNDVEGFDVAFKITILASLAFGRFVDCRAVYRQGITQVSATDISMAREFGYRIKLIGLARRGAAALMCERIQCWCRFIICWRRLKEPVTQSS